MIGREKEVEALEGCLESNESQFIAVYGRRRIGKTMLVREAYAGRFTFLHTGLANVGMAEQLAAFRDALCEYGLADCKEFRSWREAFGALKKLLMASKQEKKIVFIDEMPWMDTPRSGFVPALEYFWNNWAAWEKNIVLVICGSATSWIIKKVIRNRGGLHNRVTRQICLRPFTLRECELYSQSRQFPFSRQEIIAVYMILGGVPYYWSLLNGSESVAQNVDRLFFAPEGELRLEFSSLYKSLFKNASPHLKIVEALSGRKCGMVREEIMAATGLCAGGKITTALEELEECGLIRKYQAFGKKSRDALYQLMDNFTLFHLKFASARNRHEARHWTESLDTAEQNVWSGLAFERVCLQHVDQIRKAMGISGMLTSVCSWSCRGDGEKRGAQVDLVIDRRDRLVDLCEIKYSTHPFKVTLATNDELRRKRWRFAEETKTRRGLRTVLIAAEGVADGSYRGEFHTLVTGNDLFCDD